MPNLKVEIKVADCQQVIDQLEHDAKDIEDLMLILAYLLRNDEIEVRHVTKFQEIVKRRGYEISLDCELLYGGEILDE